VDPNSEVFHVFDTPKETWAHGDGVFDLAGWPDSNTMKQQFGSTWEDLGNPWAETFRRWNGNTIIEADIALNPAQTWTLDDEAVYDGSGFRSFRRTMTHELGHMMGFGHEFNFLSVMNYPPDNYRPFPVPFMDDAEGIRQRYPAQKVETTDLGIYLFYSAGSMNWLQADFPSSVVAGSLFTVTNYQLENVGTRAVGTPTVEWYLTKARNFNGATFYFEAKGRVLTLDIMNPMICDESLERLPEGARGFLAQTGKLNDPGSRVGRSRW
jgi:hypothetical protein